MFNMYQYEKKVNDEKAKINNHFQDQLNREHKKGNNILKIWTDCLYIYIISIYILKLCLS